jgi:hypothetical protein
MFEVHHAWKSHENSIFNIKHVYEKTSSNKYLNSSLSVNNIALYIFTHIFVAAIIPEDPCSRWTPILFDTVLCAIQSWKRVIWQYTTSASNLNNIIYSSTALMLRWFPTKSVVDACRCSLIKNCLQFRVENSYYDNTLLMPVT